MSYFRRIPWDRARCGGVISEESESRLIVRRFGDSRLSVSVVGLGVGQVGEADVEEATASEVLNGALDGLWPVWRDSDQRQRR